MVIPCLADHLNRNEQTHETEGSDSNRAFDLEIFLHQINQGCHAHTTPNGKSIERTGVSIVTLTRLHRRLVEVDDNGKSCHEEQEADYPELTNAATATESLPEESDETQQQRQTIEDIVTFVHLQIVRQLALITQAGVVEERDTRDPVAVLGLAIALNVVLATGKVPHEVAPIHEVALVGQEELDVVDL